MKKTILVVEDFTSIRNFLCDTLERAGYATIATSNGNEAFGVLNNETISVDLVLSDYNMPECTGLELLNKIKGQTGTSKIPVIFLTTERDPEKMREAQKAGLAAWVKKPYKADTFFALIENAIVNGQ
ncbi:response regulator [Ohtaekwangia koreensis]|nr:response regulator [Ohtaekwangia koreensis]